MGDNGDDKYYYNNYNYNRAHNQLDGHVALAGAALAVALASIPLGFFLNVGVMAGGLAITLALLSKGTQEKMLPQAKRAVFFGTIGVVIGYAVFAYDIYTVFTDPTAREQLNAVSMQINGVSFDDMLRDLGIVIGN